MSAAKMFTERELQILDAALARIVPDDEGQARNYVRARAASQPEQYRTAILLIESRGGEIAGLEEHPSIALLIGHAVEGYYTTPAGWAAVGFRVTA